MLAICRNFDLSRFKDGWVSFSSLSFQKENNEFIVWANDSESRIQTAQFGSYSMQVII